MSAVTTQICVLSKDEVSVFQPPKNRNNVPLFFIAYFWKLNLKLPINFLESEIFSKTLSQAT